VAKPKSEPALFLVYPMLVPLVLEHTENICRPDNKRCCRYVRLMRSRWIHTNGSKTSKEETIVEGGYKLILLTYIYRF
jgi:hypothetical protein